MGDNVRLASTGGYCDRTGCHTQNCNPVEPARHQAQYGPVAELPAAKLTSLRLKTGSLLAAGQSMYPPDLPERSPLYRHSSPASEIDAIYPRRRARAGKPKSYFTA